MIENDPLVSVIMPAYNAKLYIEEAIRSVLDQDYPNIELIVIDDGSSDGTAELAESLGERVRVIRQINGGPAAARNKGIADARGELIAFLDADDLWLPGKVSAQVRYLAEHPDVGLVYGKFIRWDGRSDGSFPPPPVRQNDQGSTTLVAEHSGRIYRELLFDNIVHIITAMVRKSVFETVGCFDEHLRTGEDYDLWLRVSREFQADKLNRTLACYRVHSQSTTCVPRAENNEYQVLLRTLRKFGSEEGAGGRGVDARLRDRLFNLCFSHGYFHYWKGNPAVAAAAFREASRHSVFRPRAWIYWALSNFKQLHSKG